MPSTESSTTVDYRLPRDVVPTHYDLTVHTDLDNAKFNGFVEIELTFNTLDLILDDISLRLRGRERAFPPINREFDLTAQRGIVTFPEPLAAGSDARLTITFSGELTSSLSGYYRSTGGADGKTVYSLTQFQPTAARRAFPCWDEPALKATFAITMLSRAGSVNLSNMPAQSEKNCDAHDSFEQGSWIAKRIAGLEDPSQWKVTQFETTPPVSTYLVAYANGPFEYLESAYKSPLSGIVRPLRIYATADNIWQGQYALEIVQRVMPLYEEVFDLEYPLPKLDILASNDFDLGGMENWGLIMGRTSCFLDDPNSDNIRNKQYVASMASHEVAHMWFGDITTMKWWDNLYLNEGVYFPYRSMELALMLMSDRFRDTGQLFPEWRLDAAFLGSEFYPAHALDAKLSSHPIEVECPDANKIIQIFDNLSYSKAASVLRMLANYVGEKMFLKGVSTYLKKHKYKNTVTSDLWEGIQSVTHKDISGMMDNWVKKASDSSRLARAALMPVADPRGPPVRMIPLSILAVREDGFFKIDSNALLTKRETFISLDTSKPFKLNAGTTGFYVVQYSADRLVQLGKQAASPDSPFTLQDRIGLVRDAFALGSSGHSTVSSALGLVDALRTTEELDLVWDAIAVSLSTIASTWWEHPEVAVPLDAFRRSMFVPVAKKLGFERLPSDTPDDQPLRAKAIEQAAEAGDSWVIGELKARFAQLLETGDDSRIPSELIGIAYRIAVQEGGKREWDFLKSIAARASSPAHALAAISALGATRDMQLAEATFEYATTEARNQNIIYIFRSLQRNAPMRRWLAGKVMGMFDELERQFTGTFTFSRLLDAAFGGLTSEDDHQKIVAFFKNKDTAAYDLQLRQTLDTIKSNARWIQRSTGDVQGWLEEHV
ncbi:hypothetical protein BN946_scf184643.g6 [Trametes cinnabarina]|uniref:Aminopeptidase n=1 Tax=Pycnoporus cinnabarinus TaxID=5643 RepID=A0A060SJB4_PYCCI|nr:hypothetical protein BN946_scf184643.g6 [Trametes cinnabarina]